MYSNEKLAHYRKRITLSILYFVGLRDSNLNDRTYKAFFAWTTIPIMKYMMYCVLSFLGEETQRSTEVLHMFTIKVVSKDCRRWLPPRV